jgi:hypothetical protein
MQIIIIINHIEGLDLNILLRISAASLSLMTCLLPSVRYTEVVSEDDLNLFLQMLFPVS